MQKGTVTLTFGDVAENHARMEQIGTMVDEGITSREILKIRNWFRGKGCETKLYHLHRLVDVPDEYKAYFLVVKGGAKKFADVDKMYDKLTSLDWDKKALMYGRVVNKKIRRNLCFADYSQEPDYEEGKGRVIDVKDVEGLEDMRTALSMMLPSKFDSPKNLMVEGNYYYDVSQCGIGYHGDGERKVTIGARFGEMIPLYYQWYEGKQPIGERVRIDVEHGDIYFMSDVATGNNWKNQLRKRSGGYHLRHAAGFKESIINPKQPKSKKK